MDDKRERARQQRLQRQNQALKEQQVIDGSSFNDPFKYKAPVRQKRATSSATGKPSHPLVVASIPIRLYLFADKKLVLCNCAQPSNDIEDMTHVLTISTSNTTPIESINIACYDRDDPRNAIVSLDIDSMFAFTVLAPGTTTSLTVQSAMIASDTSAYTIVSPQLEKISRYVALAKYYAMESEVRQGLPTVDIMQDILAAPFSSPLIEYGDLVKVRYTTYAVSEFGDYQNATVVDRVTQLKFDVGSGECQLPGVENNVVGMRKRNIRAFIISRDNVSADSDWPVLLKSGTFLVCEITIVNHRQSTESSGDRSSIIQWKSPSNLSSSVSSASIPKSSSASTTTESKRRSKEDSSSRKSDRKSTKYNDNSDDDNSNDDDDELFFGGGKGSRSKKIVEKKKPKKRITKRSGPFDASDDDDAGDDDDDSYDDDSTTVARQHQKRKGKRSSQYDDDGDDDLYDEEFTDEPESSEYVNQSKQKASAKATTAAPPAQVSPQLPTFDDIQPSSPEPALHPEQVHAKAPERHEPAPVAVPSQTPNIDPIDPEARKKEELSERMRRLATASGHGPAIPVIVPFGGGVTPSLNPVEPTSTIPQTTLSSTSQSYSNPQPQQQQYSRSHQQQQQQQSNPPLQQPQYTQQSYQTTPTYYQQQQQQPQQQQQQPHQVFPNSPHLYQTNSYHSTTPSPVASGPLNNTSSTAALLNELGVSQYLPQLINEQLFTVSDLLMLDKDDWTTLPLPMIVKRKIRSLIHEIQANSASTPVSSHKYTESPKQPIQATPEPVPVPVSEKMSSALSESQLQTEITNAYNKGCEETLAKCRQRITDMKNTANARFSELQDEISQRDQEIHQLKAQLEAITNENTRNKDLVRTYVEKTRQERGVDAAEITRLKTEAQHQAEYIQRLVNEHKVEQKNAVRNSLEAVYATFISRLGSNDVLDGEQVHKILREVLKSIGSQ